MTAIGSDYTNILKSHKILYMPSCLVVEMMTKLYSQVSTINLSGSLHNLVPDLLILLRRMSLNLRATAEAYRQNRIRFFIGDWKDDKKRARKLFYNLMSRLGYMAELFGAAEKGLLYKAIEEMTEEWTVLDQIMEEKCNESLERDMSSSHTRYFRSDSPNNWQQVMAKTILALGDDEELEDPDTYLILLCYNRIRLSLLKVVEELQKKNSTPKKLSREKVLCVSREDISISCPKCTLMTECIREGEAGTTDVIRRGYAKTHVIVRQEEQSGVSSGASCPRLSLRRISENTREAHRQYKRHIMPPSLVSINGGKR